MQGSVLAMTGKAVGRGSHDHLRDDCMALNGSNIVGAVVSIIFGEQPMQISANSMTLGAALAKR